VVLVVLEQYLQYLILMGRMMKKTCFIQVKLTVLFTQK